MVAEKFLALCYWFSRLVDQRTNNKHTKVAVINIYCNYLQQNGELIQFKQVTIQTSKQANIRTPRISIHFSNNLN